MEFDVLVLGWSGFDFLDNNKKNIVGATISYLTPYSANEQLKKGCLPIQEKVELPFAQTFQGIGIYHVVTAVVPGKNNLPVSKIVSMSFLKPVELDKLFKVA